MAPEVDEVYRAALKSFGNPSSVHQAGREARRVINESRELMADLLQIPESSLVFTSGGTESLNAALWGVLGADTSRKHAIVSPVEHSAILQNLPLFPEQALEVSYPEVDPLGRVDPIQFEAMIRPETELICLMFANNEIGNIYPVKQMGEIARKYKIPYLCDGVQAIGKLPINLTRLPIDLLAGSAHKFHGPKGVGFLYVHPDLEWQPLLRGGRQERGRRAGTENVAGIAAMAKALQLAHDRMQEEERRVAFLRDRLEKGLIERVPGILVHGDPEHRLSNTLNIRIEGVSGETALMNLDMAGIAVSVGAACESGSIEASHVLLAMGLNPQQAIGGLRFSISRYNTEKDIDRVIEIIPELVERIRKAA